MATPVTNPFAGGAGAAAGAQILAFAQSSAPAAPGEGGEDNGMEAVTKRAADAATLEARKLKRKKKRQERGLQIRPSAAVSSDGSMAEDLEEEAVAPQGGGPAAS